MQEIPTTAPARLIVLIAALALAACGGSHQPTAAPTPTPTPTPTPPPPTPTATVTLDAPSGYFVYSRSLAQLPAGRSFYVALRPLLLNHIAEEKWAHAAELWLFRVDDQQTKDSHHDGTAIAFVWSSAGWIVEYRQPGQDTYTDAGGLVQMGLGEQKWVRIRRQADGQVEFFFEGASKLKLPVPADATYVYGRVVGLKAEFAYAPPVVDALALNRASGGVSEPCGDCAPAH